MISIKSDKIIKDGKIFDGYVYVNGEKIVAVSKEKKPCDKEYDFTGYYVSPGFIDLHTHGAKGYDYTVCDEDGVVEAVNYHFSHGTTAVLPTTLASDKKNTLKALKNISNAKRSKKAKAEIMGVHIEGPYFAVSQAGAQNPKFITEPIENDYKEIVDKYGKIIKKWSYAPERDTDDKFLKFLLENGITPSAGHTNAKYEHMLSAYENGLRNVTHLYSCTSTITREQGFRVLGVIESAYLLDGMYTEIIADGRHLPSELIKMIFKLRPADKIILVTDSLSIAGSDKTEGELNGVPYVVELGVARLKDRSAFAGSVATCDRLVRECVKAGVPVEDAVTSATASPARSIGVKRGELKRGYPADIVVFDDEINIKKIMAKGVFAD